MNAARRLVLYLAAVAAVVSCGATVTSSVDPLAGTYSVKGGGAALDVFQALSDAFRKEHPLVRFSFQDIGSRAGMILAASGEVDLSTSSAIPTPDITAAVTAVPVGSSGTAVVVNKSNAVTALTKTQVADIFAGKTTEWSAVGGASDKIIVVIREATSALRSNFDAYFFAGKGTYRTDAIVLNTSDDIVRAVGAHSGIVSMVTMSTAVFAEPRLRAVAIDGVAPTRDNITAGRYPVVRPLFLIYNEKSVKPAVSAFLEFVRGPEGQLIIGAASSGG